MINRSKIKYSLKKILPVPVFSIILFWWQKLFIRFIELIDKIRLKSFVSYHPVKLSHDGKNFNLFISPKNGFIDEYIFLYGVYEPFILDLIRKYLKKDNVFVDIGANIGQHSMFASSIVGESGKVYSFEPIPKIYSQLLESASLNGFGKIIQAYNLALGEKDGTGILHISAKNIGGSSLVEKNNGEKIEVKIIDGDKILSDLKKIDLIKIDVEGYEYEALSGIQNTLKRQKPPIILEFSGELYERERGNTRGDKIISLLQNLGYTLYDIENNMEEIKDKKYFLELFIYERKCTNLLCLPKNLYI